MLKLAPLAVGAVAILAAMAWGYSWTTVYTITSRRVVMRAGVALPITINLPVRQDRFGAVCGCTATAPATFRWR